MWNTETGELLLTLPQEQPVGAVQVSPDGRRIVAATAETVRIWSLPWLTEESGDELMAAVCKRKLLGAARLLTEADVGAAPILRGREGEDICGLGAWHSVRHAIAGLFGDDPFGSSHFP